MDLICYFKLWRLEKKMWKPFARHLLSKVNVFLVVQPAWNTLNTGLKYSLFLSKKKKKMARKLKE